MPWPQEPTQAASFGLSATRMDRLSDARRCAVAVGSALPLRPGDRRADDPEVATDHHLPVKRPDGGGGGLQPQTKR
jgi:hypothetical protein